MGNPSIFKGTKTQLLTQEGIKLKNGADKDLVVGTDNPNTTAKAGDGGSLYLEDGGDNVYKKIGDGTSTKWKNIDTSPDNISHIRADYSLTTDMVTGNNAVFDNGGTFNGTLSRSTTASEIAKGSASFKWVGNATAGNNTNNFVVHEVIDIPQGSRGKDLTFQLKYRWDGTTDNMIFRVKDTTNTTILTVTGDNNLDQFIPTNNEFKQAGFTVSIPTSCAQIEIGFQCLTGEVSKTLIWDDISVSEDQVAAAAAGGGGSTIQTAYIKYVVASGALEGGSSTSYSQRLLNTLTDPDGIVTSLVLSQFTLPAGEYDFWAECPTYDGNSSKSKLRNVTDSTDEIIGGFHRVANGTNDTIRGVIMGRISIASSKTFELQTRVGNAVAVNGLGSPASFGDDEIYSQCRIVKLG